MKTFEEHLENLKKKIPFLKFEKDKLNYIVVQMIHEMLKLELEDKK